jgi:Zn-dependent M32 family carboxypeptidase
MSAFDELMAFQRETEALGQVMGRLGWDMETVMPEGAAEQGVAGDSAGCRRGGCAQAGSDPA